jgi:putative oxidoreductase
MRNAFSMTNILGWILAVVLALVFAIAGGVKLIGAPAMVAEFAQIGIGQWFRFVTGLLELGGAIGLLIPGFRFWAALQVAAVMVGATGVNLWILHVPALAGLTTILMILALVLAWLRRPRCTRNSER